MDWLLRWLLPFGMLGMTFAGDSGGGDGGGGEGEGAGDDGKGAAGDTVPKGDLEKANVRIQELEKSGEDMRMEVMTPEYLEFLDKKDKGGPTEPSLPATTDDEFEKMSKKDVYEKARKDLSADFDEKLNKVKSDWETSSKASTQMEVDQFARTHADFNKVRPMMYGLSLDKTNSKLSLNELYEMAKSEIKTLANEPTDDEKDIQRKMGGEKPTGGSKSFDKDKKYTAESAANEAWDENIGEGGLPPAV